jgi:predicted Rossmann-fold nucleotide-binding protein
MQTGTGRRMPVILVGSSFWRGLLHWMEDTLVVNGMIGAEDMKLMTVVDDSDAVVNAIFDFYEAKGFDGSAADRERVLYL